MTTIHPPEGFRHLQFIQVRWGDLDAMGHVNNATYLTYLEQARISYFTAVGLWDGTERGIAPIMAKVTLDYRRPLFATDEVYVCTRTIRLGNRSFEQEQRIVTTGADGLQVAAQSMIILVSYDYAAGTSVPIPQAWRERIAAYEPTAVET